MSQTARITITAAQLAGAVATLSRDGKDPVTLKVDHAQVLNLKPGDRITVEIAAANRGQLTDLDAKARADIDANPEAGENLTDRKGMTLEQGLKVDAEANPEPEAPAPGVTVQDGPTRRTTTRGR